MIGFLFMHDWYLWKLWFLANFWLRSPLGKEHQRGGCFSLSLFPKEIAALGVRVRVGENGSWMESHIFLTCKVQTHRVVFYKSDFRSGCKFRKKCSLSKLCWKKCPPQSRDSGDAARGSKWMAKLMLARLMEILCFCLLHRINLR